MKNRFIPFLSLIHNKLKNVQDPTLRNIQNVGIILLQTHGSRIENKEVDNILTDIINRSIEIEEKNIYKYANKLIHMKD